MPTYFNDFFNGWTEHNVYFARSNDPDHHDAQEALWHRVYDNVAMLVSRTNLGLSIERFDVRRIALQPGRNQNGPRLLRQEPFLYAYSDENDFFVIKFVFSPDNGIQIGIDYRGIRERNNDARMRFHQYLQLPLPTGFILKGSRKGSQEGSQQYTNANKAIEALQTRGENRESKIEPCFIIHRNDTYDDERYLQDMEIALRNSSAFRDTLINLDTNYSKTEQKKDMANDDMSQEEGFFTLKQVQEFFNRFGRRSQKFFDNNIKITGVTYDSMRLERAEPISRDDTTPNDNKRDAMKYMTADIFFMLKEKRLACDEKKLLSTINGKDKEYKYKGIFASSGGKTVTLRTNIGAGNLLSNLAQTFVPEITKADPEKLEFSYILKAKFPDLLMDWLDITHEKPSTSKGNDVSAPKHPRNCIWAGAPGTGKSWELNSEAHSQFDANNIMRVTFHPEYTYYDFVGTYRPRMAKNDEGNTMGKIEYAFVPGPFAKMLKRALWNRNANYCLIIEEINRANAAAVFGDVFQLLDRSSEDSEDGSVRMHESEYSICPSEELYEYLMNKQEGNEEMQGTDPSKNIVNALRLPANLYIWATMNSADQGVFPMDTAFKRRWSFVNMDINPSEKNIDDWDKIRRGINDMLLKHHVQEDKLMGYYFLKKEERDSKENLEKALKEKVLLYLFEDAAKPFRGKIFKNEYNTCEKLRGKLVVDDPNLGVFLEKVWDGIPQQSKPEDTKQATEDVDNDDNP